jgi:hypothetical protein
MKLKKKQNKRLLVKCLIILFNSDILEAFTVRLFKKKKKEKCTCTLFLFPTSYGGKRNSSSRDYQSRICYPLSTLLWYCVINRVG